MAIPAKLAPWLEARKRFHLSDAHIQMARELGMNPKKFGKLANHRQEPWKAPLPQFIERCYFKSFGKHRPDTVRSIEQTAADQKQNKLQARQRRQQRQASNPAPADALSPAPHADSPLPPAKPPARAHAGPASAPPPRPLAPQRRAPGPADDDEYIPF